MLIDEIFEGRLGDIAGAAAYLASLGLSGYKGEQEIARNASSPTEQTANADGVTVQLPDAKVTEPKAAPHHNALRKQATLLALTMWGEARSHGPQGMRAIGHVILNRMDSDRDFGGTVKDVVMKRKAFSCWNPSDPNREAMREIKELPKNSLDYKRWMEAKKLAVMLLAHQLKDTTNGSLFYHTDGVDPAWAQGIKPVAQIANHYFYRNDAKG